MVREYWIHSLTVVVALALLSQGDAGAADPQSPLPKPLTLEYALSLSGDSHPDLEYHRALIDQSDAERGVIEADNGPDIRIEAALRAIDPSDIAYDQSSNDSNLKLRLSKVLYDFGRTRHRMESNAHNRSGNLWQFIQSRQKKHLEILSNYLDVLLADLAYIRDNEFMTMAFLRWDKARERNLLGQVSDITTLELEAEFNQRRRERLISENQQRLTRSRLAISLNRPSELSSDLERPRLGVLEREPGGFEELMNEILAQNPRLQALRERTKAAQSSIDLAKSGGNPVLRGELTAAAYARESGSKHPLEAGLQIDIPLFQSGSVDAAVAAKRAELRRRRAELAGAEYEIRQAALDLWMELEVLRLQIEEIRALGDYRELYLDRSRALYEMEVQSDIGDAQAKISDYQYRKAETEFQIVMTWARLDALRGRLGGVSGEDPDLRKRTGK